MNFPPLARATLALAAAPWCISAQTSFTMVVFNYSAAPRSVIELAAATARRAFLAARIQSRWIVCEESCSQGLPPGPAMQAFVMPRLRATLPGSTTHHTAGYAVPSGFPHSHAYAFWDAASEAAERTERPIYVVLGCILAHETGHLLGLAHQPHGVMRANLEGIDMDEATRGRAFTWEEAKRLRAMVKQLAGLPSASLVLPEKMPVQ